jgi:hypothetical protein
MARDAQGRFAKDEDQMARAGYVVSKHEAELRGDVEEVSKKSGLPSGARLNSVPSGLTGLKQTNGYVYEEFLRDLTGPNAAHTYKEMRDNDPVIGAMFFGLEMFMRQVSWFVDPPLDIPETEGQAKAKFLEQCKDDMSQTWSDFICEAMTMMEHGWQWSEILYKMRNGEQPEDSDQPSSKYDDGKIGWRKFDPRSQDSLERWDFDDEGGIRGMFQRPAPTYEEKYVPIAKSMLFRTTVKKNNPEGRSILRNAYRPWYFKKRIEEIEGVGIERDLAGLPFAEVPAEMMREDASEADKATLQSIVDLVKNVRRDEQEGVVWPQSWDENGVPQYQFKLMASSGTRQFDTDKVITRYDSRIAMVILFDLILLGNDSSTGSFALATTKSGLLQSALSAWLDMMQDVINNYAVPRLFRLNGDHSGKYPKFRHEEVQQPSLADLATFVAALTGAGAQLFPDINLENHFRNLAQLPLREVEQKILGDEDELREKKVEAQIAAAKETIKNPGGPPPAPIGKDPNSVPGAPTKTTGKVKSKLPPQSRRRTKAVDAAENVKKRRVVRRKN